MSTTLSVPEALIWMERTLADAGVRANVLWQLPVTALLRRSGEPVAVGDHAIDIAAVLAITMSLIHGDRCNAAVVTDSPGMADALFTSDLLGAPALTPLLLGLKAGRHFLNISGNTVVADAVPALEGMLHDPALIPVGPVEAFARVREAGHEQVRRYQDGLSWWRKRLARDKPWPQEQARLLYGIWMLNAVVQVGLDWVAMSDAMGEDALDRRRVAD